MSSLFGRAVRALYAAAMCSMLSGCLTIFPEGHPLDGAGLGFQTVVLCINGQAAGNVHGMYAMYGRAAAQDSVNTLDEHYGACEGEVIADVTVVKVILDDVSMDEDTQVVWALVQRDGRPAPRHAILELPLPEEETEE